MKFIRVESTITTTFETDIGFQWHFSCQCSSPGAAEAIMRHIQAYADSKKMGTQDRISYLVEIQERDDREIRRLRRHVARLQRDKAKLRAAMKGKP